MKNIFLGLFALTVLMSCGQNKDMKSKASKAKIETEIDSFSYALGALNAKNLKRQGLDNISPDAFAKALYDVIVKGEDPMFDDKQANEILTAYSQKMNAEKEAEMAEKAKTAKADGIAFLAENGKKEGVVTTASGLQYTILKEGTGSAHPTATSKVKVHYHGTTIDGNVFDSSLERGQPIDFPLNGVIKGWTEGVQLMTVGSKFKFFIPSELAYGARGAGADIPPHATLIFEVELLDIVQ